MIRELQREVREWTGKNFPNNKPHMPLLGAMEELGELAHAHLKQEQGIATTRGNKRDAIGDIIIYLCNYCSLNDIDIQTAIEVAWDNVQRRNAKTSPDHVPLVEEKGFGVEPGQRIGIIAGHPENAEPNCQCSNCMQARQRLEHERYTIGE